MTTLIPPAFWSGPREHGVGIEIIMSIETEFPEETKGLKKAARKTWQQRHKQNPKYDTAERTPAQFLAEVPVQEVEVEAKYVKERRGDAQVGRWRMSCGETGSAEDIATDYHQSAGYQVYRCERKLISMLVVVLCWPVIQDPNDPRGQGVIWGSTESWPPGIHTPLINFLLPQDFGSAAFFDRRERTLEVHLGLLEEAGELGEVFDSMLEGAETLRGYLWVAEDDAEELTRVALSAIPKALALKMVR